MQGWRISQEVSGKSRCRRGGDGGNGRGVRARARASARARLSHRYPVFRCRLFSPVARPPDYRPRAPRSPDASSPPRRAGERGRRRPGAPGRSIRRSSTDSSVAHAFIYQQMRYLDKTGSLRHVDQYYHGVVSLQIIYLIGDTQLSPISHVFAIVSIVSFLSWMTKLLRNNRCFNFPCSLLES